MKSKSFKTSKSRQVTLLEANCVVFGVLEQSLLEESQRVRWVGDVSIIWLRPNTHRRGHAQCVLQAQHSTALLQGHQNLRKHLAGLQFWNSKFGFQVAGCTQDCPSLPIFLSFPRKERPGGLQQQLVLALQSLKAWNPNNLTTTSLTAIAMLVLVSVWKNGPQPSKN